MTVPGAGSDPPSDPPEGASPASKGSGPEGPGPVEDAPFTMEDRLERLERQVEALERGFYGRRAPPGDVDVPPPSGVGEASGPRQPTLPTALAPRLRPSEPRPPASRSRTAADWLRLGEDWLGRVGVVLLLLGLAFLYRYAIDQGWVTPELRVSFGLLLGGGLLFFGLKRTTARPFYSQVLLGGALAVLYLTGWAAHVLYGLVGWAAGFAFMGMVTILALTLTERRGHAALAVIGASGGLSTPFLLEPPAASVTGLVVYAVLVLAWSGLLQLRRGWGALLAVNFLGGVAVMGVAAGAAGGVERFSVQVGLVAWWMVACGFPYLRGWLLLRNPDRWPPRAARAPRDVTDPPKPMPHALLWGLAVGASSLAVVLTIVTWDLGRVGSGAAFLVAAAVLLGGSQLQRPHARPALEAGALLLVAGTALVAGREWLPLPLALGAAAFLWFSRKEGIASLATLAHLTFGLLALDYVGRMSASGEGAWGPYPIAVLAATAVAAACAARLLRDTTAVVYSFASYAAFLAWLAWQITPLPNGHGLTSGAWGVCAVLLLGMGARSGAVAVRTAGLGTLALVAAKLLLVDLSALAPGLRILLFLGFGVLFLLLGSVFKGTDARRRDGPDR